MNKNVGDYKNVLLTFSKQDNAWAQTIAEGALNGASDKYGRPVSAFFATDSFDALAKTEQIDIHFMVVGHALASNARSPVEEDGGIDLCKSLRARGFASPILLLVPHKKVLTNSLFERCRAHDVTLYHVDTEVVGLIKEQVRAYSPPMKTLEVQLRRQPDATWDYDRTRFEFSISSSGTIAGNRAAFSAFFTVVTSDRKR